MFAQIWRMRCRKKKAEAYEKFGREVTLPALKTFDGCLGAHFVRVFEARKPEYLWLVLWRDNEALEAARKMPAWREQIKRFEAGKFYKTIPLELLCEFLATYESSREGKPEVARKAAGAEDSENAEASVAKAKARSARGRAPAPRSPEEE